MWMYAICVSIPILRDAYERSATNDAAATDAESEPEADLALNKVRETIETLKVALREHGCVELVQKFYDEAEATGSYYYCK